MSAAPVAAPASRARPALPRRGLLFAALALCAVFAALGDWQLQRRAWKLELIARVESRVHAAPVPLAQPAAWPGLDAAAEAYRRVIARGRFLPGRDTLVQASTELGPGDWVLAPFELDGGGIVLVNRGFVPPGWKALTAPADPAPSEQELIGLLRPSEPEGRLLRRNEPAADRWYSRDVEAIAVAHGLSPIAPFFIDAQAPAAASPPGPAEPVPGLTVIAFRNDHLVYALTWFALAAMSASGAFLLACTPRGPLAPEEAP